MNEDSLEIDLLIFNYINDNLSEDDYKILQDLSDNPDFKKRFEESTGKLFIIQNAQKWNSVDKDNAKKHIHSRLNQRKLGRTFISYAASVAVILSIVLIYLLRPIEDNTQLPAEITELNEPRNITLSYNQGYENILLDSLTPGKITNIENILITDSNTIVYNKIEESYIEAEMHSLTVPKGCEYSIILEDGTRIWLNSETTVNYLSSFANEEKRIVYLTGEAYFEVAKNENKPFLVHTNDVEIQVLGTTFNIKSYPEDESATTTLLTGKVEQYLPEINEKHVLSPKYQIIYNRSTFSTEIKKADLKEVMAWKNGQIIMKSKSLEYIFRQLSRWYDFEVIYSDESVKNMIFHLNMDRYENIDDILNKIEKTNGVKFIKKNRIIEVFEMK